ncbi:MAG: carbohydrate ABC transporter substrate-binding protein [Spirochaetales bacterium]|nr:carbohydrate ABC transporter substrate-binding protein [Spirochaetales bacterium]
MKKTRILAVLALVAALAPATWAEGQKEEALSNEEVTLKLSVFQGANGKEFWEVLGERFTERYPNVKVEVKAHPQIGEVVRTDFLSGNVADFIYMSISDPVTASIVMDKEVADITEEMKSIEDKFLPGFLDTPSMSPYGDGKIYLAPHIVATTGLWYNKTLFEKEGLALPKDWNEVFSLANTIQDRELFVYQGIYPGYLQCFVYSMFASAPNGYETMKRIMNYDSSALDDPGFRQGLEILAQMKDNDALMKEVAGLDHTTSQSMFLRGDATFIPCGTWIVNEMKDAPKEEGFVYGMMASPSIVPGAEQWVSSKTEEVWIPKSAPNMEWAKKFLLFLYEDQNIELQAEMTASIPPVKGLIETLTPYADPAVVSSLESLQDPNVKGFSLTFAPVAGLETPPDLFFLEQIGGVMNQIITVDEFIETVKPVLDEAKAVLNN